MDDRALLSPSVDGNRAPCHRAPLGVRFKSMVLVAMGTLLLGNLGCVERRMTIRTNTDSQGGALVYIDKEEVGYSPVSTGFTYYADREIKLVKDGYETVTLVQPVRAPWWDCLLIEFFTENLWPFTLRDERQFRYDLAPTASVSTNEVIQRGQQLRNEAQQGAELVPGVRPSGAAAPISF
jgi:hypothetical protein